MQTEVLNVEHLHAGYRIRNRIVTVVRDLTACVPRGCFVAVIGRNGAGKSTLLRTLLGFQPPLSGQVAWMGKTLQTYRESELARTVSVVLTERCPSERLTVRETVALGRIPYTGFWGAMTVADREATDRAMYLAGLEQLADRRIGSLSDGERQKTMIAKALAQETPVIILDEPTAFLDFPSKVEMLRLLRRLVREERKTVLASLHDLELAMQLADILWMVNANGRLTAGPPRSLAASGAFDAFLGGGICFDPQTLRYRLEDV